MKRFSRWHEMCIRDSGIGAGLFGYGIAKWCVALWGAKNPDLMKLNEIEVKDERNQLIRSKAPIRLWFGYNCNAPEKPLQGGNNNACS